MKLSPGRQSSAFLGVVAISLLVSQLGCSAGSMPSPSIASAPAKSPVTPSVLSFAGEGGSTAQIPLSYHQGTPSRWVIYLHGYDQTASTIWTGNYATVANALLSSDYVVISMNNTVQNCYGNPQCSTDVANLVRLYRQVLTLEPEPYVMADSMGGFTLLNAIASGSIAPRAVVGWCINTNLSWDFFSGGAAAPITSDYGISPASSYDTATSGADPMLDPGAVFASTSFALWSSYSDTVVLRSENTDPFTARVEAAGGSVAVYTSEGNHLDASNFDAAAVLAFFNAH